jgi:hypothetical protein
MQSGSFLMKTGSERDRQFRYSHTHTQCVCTTFDFFDEIISFQVPAVSELILGLMLKKIV